MSPPLLGLGLVRKLVVSGLSHQTHLQRERERDELNVRTTLPAAPALKTVKPETQKRQEVTYPSVINRARAEKRQ